jgi:hypothetical protein
MAWTKKDKKEQNENDKTKKKQKKDEKAKFWFSRPSSFVLFQWYCHVIEQGEKFNQDLVFVERSTLIESLKAAAFRQVH